MKFMLSTSSLSICLSLFLYASAGVSQAIANDVKDTAVDYTNYLEERKNWHPISKKERVKESWPSGKILQVSSTERAPVGRVIYDERIPLIGSRLSMTLDFLEENLTVSTGGGLILFGLTDEAGESLAFKIYPEKEVMKLGEESIDYSRLPENPYHYEIEMTFDMEEVVLYWGGRERFRQKVTFNQALVSLSVFAEEGSVQISKLDISTNEANAGIIERDGEDVRIDLAHDSHPIPSPWTDYWGTHYVRVRDESDPSPHIRYSAVRSYGAPHVGITSAENREHAPEFQGPFDDQRVHVEIDSFRRSWDSKEDIVASQLIPELIKYDLIGIWQVEMTNQKEGLPRLEQNLYYHFLDQVYTEWPNSKEHMVWQIGNEIVSKHWNPKSLTPEERRQRPEGLPSNQYNVGYDLNWKLDFYINHWLAPSVQVIERVSQEHFGDPHAIPVAVGSMNPYNSPNVWFLDNLMESRFGEDAPEALRGDYTWEHFDYLTVHYMFTPGSGERIRNRMDRYLADYLRTGKVKGIWITELHGRAGKGPTTILESGFKFLDWVVEHQLTADQTKVFWWGDRMRVGGSGAEMAFELGKFFQQMPLNYTCMKTEDANVYVVSDRDDQPGLAMICIIPEGRRGYADIGKIKLSGIGWDSRQWNVNAVQYSPISPPEDSPVAVANEQDNLVFDLSRRITQPFIIWLKQDEPGNG